MKRKNVFLKISSLLFSAVILFSSCASTTMITSKPSGAKIYMDGEYVGTTPYKHKDTKIVGTRTNVELKKEGYEAFTTELRKNEKADVGAIIGGVFFLVPFLWTMKYNPDHNYELIPETKNKVEETSIMK